MVTNETINPNEEIVGKINRNLTLDQYACDSFELEGFTPTQITGVKEVHSSPYCTDILQKRVEFLRTQSMDDEFS